MKLSENSKKQLTRERWNLLLRIDKFLSTPMTMLAFVWLVLTILELTRGLGPFLNSLVTSIWVIFWIHFLLQFLLAPSKRVYLKHNWLTGLSLIIPAIRMFRLLRLLRYASFVRGAYLIKVLSSINRSMNVLTKKFSRKGLLYVVSLSIVVVLAGGAGIMAFEKEHGDYFTSFGVAVWWTTMMITTMGTDYFPKSGEGRVLSILLAVYGFAIFGYVTASVASFFIDTDKLAKGDEKLAHLEKEIKELKESIQSKS